jgi:hypothetical protein
MSNMRTILIIAFMLVVNVLKAQVMSPLTTVDNSYRGVFGNNLHDSNYNQKWSLTRYSAISTGFMTFRGGSATYFAAPFGLQLNRRLTNNLFAFAGVSLEPTYINFNCGFMGNDFIKGNQNNNLYKTGNLGLYSRAQLGLQYINDDRTFSISGSLSVERGSYPVLPYNQVNNQRINPVMSTNR